MTDAPVLQVGENSPEYVAYRLMRDVLTEENNANHRSGQNAQKPPRERILDTYAECLQTVRGNRELVSS